MAGAVLIALVTLYAALNWQRYEGLQVTPGLFLPARVPHPCGARYDCLRTGNAHRGGSGWLDRGFVLAAACLAIARPAEERAKIVRLWVPMWAVVLAAIVWFILLKSEFIVSPVPMWLGWLSMTAFVVWCALATVQVKLQGVLSESVFLTAKTSPPWCVGCSSVRQSSRPHLRCSAARKSSRNGCSLARTDDDAIHAAFAVHHIHPWLAAGWTEIIVIFMPIFIPLTREVQRRSSIFRTAGCLEFANRIPVATSSNGSLYLKG